MVRSTNENRRPLLNLYETLQRKARLDLVIEKQLLHGQLARANAEAFEKNIQRQIDDIAKTDGALDVALRNFLAYHKRKTQSETIKDPQTVSLQGELPPVVRMDSCEPQVAVESSADHPMGVRNRWPLPLAWCGRAWRPMNYNAKLAESKMETVFWCIMTIAGFSLIALAFLT
jgi:hypothetical protein